MTSLDAVGWCATAVFSFSYLCRDSRTLRWIQAGGALIWLTYGILLHSAPVIVANLIVTVAAAGSVIRQAISATPAEP